MRTISITVMIIISKVLLLKLLDITYVQSSFSFSLTTVFERHLAVEDFTAMDQHTR